MEDTLKAMKAEAKDLRIGNIIYSHDKGSKGYTYVNHRIISDIASNQNHTYEYIPLTSDWLIRMGFEKEVERIRLTEFYSIHGLRFMQMRRGLILIDPNGKMIWKKKFWFVHEIQNLTFALTGTELEVKL